MALMRMPNCANSRQRGDAALGGGIGGLADLSFERRDRGGGDDHAALAVRERAEALHVGGDEPHHVEGADQVDGDDAFEIAERHRAIAANDAFRRSYAGAIDQDAGRAVPVARLPQRGGGLLGIGDVAMHGVAGDLFRDRARAVEIDVEAGDLDAGAGEFGRGRRAQAGGAAGHDSGVSFHVHGQFFRAGVASGFSISSAMPWPPPMQAEAMP